MSEIVTNKKKKKIKLVQNEAQEDNFIVASLDGQAPFFVLFEHAIGYTLFKVKQFEEIGLSFADKLKDNTSNFSKFCTLVQIVAFSPFKSAINALENINFISEGMVHEDLYFFLDSYLPKNIGKIILGVSDIKLAQSLNENKELKINTVFSGIVPDVIRGIRQHFSKFFKTFQNKDITDITFEVDDSKEIKAQLGLAHSYSRAKIKFNVNRVDNMIIQCISILDQLDKDINKFAMRLREWYSYHFPELYKIVPDNLMYSKVVKIICDRKSLFQGSDQEKLTTIHEDLENFFSHDPDKVLIIEKAAKSSMGMDISPLDLNMVIKFSDRVLALGDFRKNLTHYLNQKMKLVAPNLAELLGDTISARLISHAGSLSNLAKCPASTIQILGAEKALFRALKSRSGNTPKYGLLFHSAFITKSGPTNKGKVSRYLANKCALASRIDCFSDIACPVYGQFLKTQVENRINYLENNEEPIKNDDLMAQAKEKAKAYIEHQIEVEKKMEKKAKKNKKKVNGHELDDNQVSGSETIATSLATSLQQLDADSNISEKKKKKKKRKYDSMNGDMGEDILLNGDVEIQEEITVIKKSKISAENSANTILNHTNEIVKKKKKKKEKIVEA